MEPDGPLVMILWRGLYCPLLKSVTGTKRPTVSGCKSAIPRQVYVMTQELDLMSTMISGIYDERFNRLDVRSGQLAGRMNLLQWMVGTNILLTIGVLWNLLSMKP